MKLLGFAIVAGLGAVLPAPASPPGEGAVALDRFIARVNDRVITQGDLVLFVHEQERRIRLQAPPEEAGARLSELYREGFRQLLDRALILEEAARRQAAVDDRTVEEAVGQIVREQFGNDRTAFLQALARENLSFDDFRERTRENLLVSILRSQEIGERVRVSPRELRGLYEGQIERFTRPEEVRLRAILLHLGETPGDFEAKRAQARRLHERLLAQEDFAALAREHSEGFGAASGGNWDWVRAGDLMPELRGAVADMDPGQTSPVLEAGPWLYLLRLEARRPRQVVPFEEARREVEAELLRQREERAFRGWMDQLEARHYVSRLAEPWIDGAP